MLPAKVRAAVRGLIKGRVARLIEQLRMDPDPMMDGLISETARRIGEAGCMLDPEAASSAVGEHYDCEARQYAKVCTWDGECETDAVTDDGLCAEHAAEQAREFAAAQVDQDEGAS
jgi:hypothetical protein